MLEFDNGWRLDGDVWIGPGGERLSRVSGGTGIETAALIAVVIGAAVAAYGAYSSAEAQQTQLKQQKSMHEADAEMARQAGVEAASRQRKKDKYALNAFGARAGMAGVVAHEGSSLLAELDFAEQSELEAQNVQYGYKVQEARSKTQASFAKWQAGRINPMMAAGTSLVQSAASGAGSYASGGFGGGAGVAGAQTGGGLATGGMSSGGYSLGVDTRLRGV